MMMSQLAEALDASLHGQDVLMTGVSKDSRDIHHGDLYVALVGERFDGHRFVEQARAGGAVGALVSELQADASVMDIPQVQVADTRIALGKLAAHWAAQWHEQYDGRLIGITGSNGKTSVKEMCRKILVEHAGEAAVLSTHGNLNNDIGMPMMLLELREQHRFAVIEMGANHVGEIDYLTAIAKPDVAIVNNVGPAHLEGFGSLENISRAKAEIYNGLSQDGTAVINLDDHFSPFWLDYCHQQLSLRHVVTFSMQDDVADVFAKQFAEGVYQVTAIGESAELRLTVPGRHNVMNALAAIAATVSVGVPVQTAVEALSDFENIQGRLTINDTTAGYRVIDDSYNANPLSVSAAIDVLASMEAGQRILVLGDMAELGEDAQRLHAEIGGKAKAAGIDALYATGRYSKHAVSAFAEGGHWFDSRQALAEALHKDLQGSQTGEALVLVKGSRSAAMEKVVEQILTHEKNNKRVN